MSRRKKSKNRVKWIKMEEAKQKHGNKDKKGTDTMKSYMRTRKKMANEKEQMKKEQVEEEEEGAYDEKIKVRRL